MVRFGCVLALMSAVAGGCGDPRPSPPRPANADEATLFGLFDEYWDAEMREHPLRATFLGDHRFDDKLEDLSEPAEKAAASLRRDLLARLDGIDASRVGEGPRLSMELFRRQLQNDLLAAELPIGCMPIDQQHGPHFGLPMLRHGQPMRSEADCARYAARLAAFPAQVDQIIERMRDGARRGMVAPRVIIEKALPAIEAQVRDNPRESELITAFLGGGGREAIMQGMLRGDLVPAVSQATAAYARLRDFLRNEYLPVCRTTVGYCDLPDGRALYAKAARLHTTTDMTPPELHALGVRELERIHTEMREIMRRVGFEGDVPAFFDHLRGRPDMHASSAAELLSGHEAILKRSDALLPKIFGRLPKTPYEVREIEAFRAPAAPAGYYYAAPEDGSRPAYFYVNTFKPQSRPRYTMEALAYHEAMPGHHLQIALAQERRDLPKFRRYDAFTVFVEGWGLYSECLGKELGGYTDPYSDFGRLGFDAWRACRLVVDTGLHDQGWSRDRAIDFMRNHVPLSLVDIESEIDRYIARPGQALAYKVGQLEIARMRREAEQALGSRFDLRSFHDAVLSEGPVPLDLLQARIDDWMTHQRGPGAGA